jgi:hypothetical protein
MRQSSQQFRHLARFSFSSALILLTSSFGCSDSSNDNPLQSACPAGQANCGMGCVDVTMDPLNCGACGVMCNADQQCGATGCECRVGLMNCAGACVDTNADPANCGGCGISCTGQVCSLGACSDTCGASLTNCAGACVNPATDSLNCGTCGTVCPAGQTCVNSACACPAGQQACGTACTNVMTDSQNCGSCGNVCPTGSTCSAGGCVGGGTGGAGGTGGGPSGGLGGSLGGSGGTTGGASGSGGMTGGTSGSGGMTGGTSGSGGMTGGTSGSGGMTGGTSGSGGTGGGTGGANVDQNGKPIACAGETTDVPQDYLRLDEIRILNNNWGSEDLGCFAPTSTMNVFVDQDGSFGWNFSRGDCADNGNPPTTPPDTSHPDFPQVEFGIHPFGIGSNLVTSPEFSSTDLMPLQLSQVSSASITLNNLSISLGGANSWNLAMEFWLSNGDPREASASVHTELMAWWGWNTDRWECGETSGNSGPPHGDTVNSSGRSYTLCHQADNWADGWRYYQFRAGNGDNGSSSTSFNGTIDIGAFIDYLVNQRGYSRDLWLTRMEVGSEIDDDTNGSVRMSGITFEVNGDSRSATTCQ